MKNSDNKFPPNTKYDYISADKDGCFDITVIGPSKLERLAVYYKKINDTFRNQGENRSKESSLPRN